MSISRGTIYEAMTTITMFLTRLAIRRMTLLATRPVLSAIDAIRSDVLLANRLSMPPDLAVLDPPPPDPESALVDPLAALIVLVVPRLVRLTSM